MKTDRTLVHRATYLLPAFGDLDDMARRLRVAIDQYKIDADTLVGTGLSGTLVVPNLARALDLYWVIVRKDGGSHSNYRFEGRLGVRWLFVDDQIETGATLRRVQTIIGADTSDYHFKTTYVGTWGYLYDRFYTESEA